MINKKDVAGPAKCQKCCKEIPESAAKSAEGKDYAWQLCGPCYTKWHTEKNSTDQQQKK